MFNRWSRRPLVQRALSGIARRSHLRVMSLLVLIALLVLFTRTSRATTTQTVIDNAGAPAEINRTPADVNRLINALGANNSEAQRQALITQLANLKGAPVTQALIAALNSPDVAVRASVAQVLAKREDTTAIPNLLVTTRDPSPIVRHAGVQALAQLKAWQALPRLTEMEINDPAAEVRQAAANARQAFQAQVATELGVPANQLRGLWMTPDLSWLYVITPDGLYGRHTTAWQRLGSLPNGAFAIATGKTARVVFAVTETLGLFKSIDNGQTWEHVQYGIDTPTALMVTAIVVDPNNDENIYAALATPSAVPTQLDSIGVSASQDGGKTWLWLENSPVDTVTTRLTLDEAMPNYLFGLANNTPWRYKLK